MIKHCTVCGVSRGLHEHHVVPRAYGGLNGPTVTICGTHHTLIHDLALKKTAEREKLLSRLPEAQQPRIKELVDIIRRARVASKDYKRPLTMQLVLDAGTASKLRRLKRALGAKSLQQTLIHSILVVYNEKRNKSEVG